MSNIGSAWSKWDLHVHTPASLIQNYGTGGVDPWDAFLEDLEQLPPEFSVIGVNDYWFLDGYRRLLEEKNKNGRLTNIDLLLPVLELRTSDFGSSGGGWSRLNLHVIFSDQVDPDVIQSQFINGLKCDLQLLPDGLDKSDWASLITLDSLTRLGADLKASIPPERRSDLGSDLQAGFKNYNVGFEATVALLRHNTLLQDRYLLAVGKTEWSQIKWTNQSAAHKKNLVNRAAFVFTAAPTPASFLESRNTLRENGVNHRVLDCSDAHYLSDSAQPNRIGECMTWINASPTFEGLRHAYFEYDSRVYIGDVPEKLRSVRSHPTSYISGVTVTPIDENVPAPTMDIAIPFNPGFVAVVGNKGNGKSALTDVVATLARSQRWDSFSFLTARRFCDPGDNRGARHRGVLTWHDSTAFDGSLSPNKDRASVEAVQYLPQNYLEKICNEDPGNDELFARELGEVIFSHVPDVDRMGATSLEALVEARTSASEHTLAILRDELDEILRRIAELERLSDPEELARLQNHLKAKQLELDRHNEAKPEPVGEPLSDDDALKSSLEVSAETVRDRIRALETKIRARRDEAAEKTLKIEQARTLRREIDNFMRQYRTFVERLTPVASGLGIDLPTVVQVHTELESIDQRTRVLEAERQDALTDLEPTADGSPARLLHDATEELRNLESQLDAPRRAYQAYLTSRDDWERLHADIVGSPATPGTLAYLQASIAAVQAAPAELRLLKESRDQKVRGIHTELRSQAAVYREIYEPVQRFIDDNEIARDRIELSIEVALIEESLAESLFPMINRQVGGTFAGQDESRVYLDSLLASHNFDDVDETLSFVTSIDDDLHFDNRPGRESVPTRPLNQVRKGHRVSDVYGLVFGLSYLTPRFWIRSGNRPISQLSPGQRGALLLLFYLLVERSQRPIILDQPEENLDNQTVHEFLVPAIEDARKRRQVIVVTHNPNLAVVGDADQVIVADLNDGRFEYKCGALEDREINRLVIDILEGTWPAFRNRSDKYIPVGYQ